MRLSSLALPALIMSTVIGAAFAAGLDLRTFLIAYALFCTPWALLLVAGLARDALEWWRDRPVRKAEHIIGHDLDPRQRAVLRAQLMTPKPSPRGYRASIVNTPRRHP